VSMCGGAALMPGAKELGRAGTVTSLAPGATSNYTSVAASNAPTPGAGGEAGPHKIARAQVSNSVAGCILRVDRAQFGSKDDASVYKWAADQLQEQRGALTLKGSLAEKYRLVTVVAFNARTLDVEAISGILHGDRQLHRRLVNTLLKAIHSEAEFHITFDSADEAIEELSLVGEEDDSERVRVELSYSKGGQACEAGVQDRDELTQIVCKDSTYVKPKDIRRIWSKFTEDDVDDPVTLTIRSQAPHVADVEVVKRSVEQAGIIATLLPSWQEMLAAKELQQSGSSANGFFQRRDGFFKVRCTLVKTLLQHGWELRHEAFLSSAEALHRHLQPATGKKLKKLFEKKEDADLREELLLAQLEVLVAAWDAVPRLVKEDRPRMLQALFAPSGDYPVLPAMLDGLRVADKRWQAQRQEAGQDGNVPMPPELLHFFERVHPEDMEGSKGGEHSVLWISKAWQEQAEDKEVQKILDEFADYYRKAEAYWKSRVAHAKEKLDETQSKFEQMVDNEEIKVVMVGSKDDLKKVHNLLDKTLKLTRECRVGDSGAVRPGMKLVLDQGAVQERFKTATPEQIHARFMEMQYSINKGVLRLLFSSESSATQGKDMDKVLKDFEALMRVVKKAATAFPDSVLSEVQSLNEKLLESKLRMKDQEARHKLHVQEEELKQAMTVATMRLQTAERKKKEVEDQNEKLTVEKDKLAKEKAVAERRKRDTEEKYNDALQVNQINFSEKEELKREKEELKREKDELGEKTKHLEEEKKLWVEQKKKMGACLATVDGFLQQQESSAEASSGHLQKMRGLINTVTHW